MTIILADTEEATKEHAMTMTLAADPTSFPTPRRGWRALLRRAPTASAAHRVPAPLASGTSPTRDATAAASPIKKRKTWLLPTLIAVPALLALMGAGFLYWTDASAKAAVPPAAPALSAEALKEAAERPLAAPRMVDPTATAATDYEIVSIFGSEAMLATRGSLLRITPGQSLPGLGTILSVTASGEGGVIEATEATLRLTAAQ